MRTPEQIAAGLVEVRQGRDWHEGQGDWQAWWEVLVRGERTGRYYRREDADRDAAVFVRAIADAVRPLYDEARWLEELLAVACHDEAGLVELGRREERGRVLGWADREEPTAMTPYAHDVLDRLRGFVEEAGPTCGLLPPAQARARVERLEGALRKILALVEGPPGHPGGAGPAVGLDAPRHLLTAAITRVHAAARDALEED